MYQLQKLFYCTNELHVYKRNNELFSAICGVLSINSQVQVRIQSRSDEERTPTRCSIIIDLRLSFVYAEVYAFKVKSL